VEPWCFKNVRKLPVTYYAKSKAWLTTDFQRLDASFGALGRKILLFVDNCASHSPDASSLRNMKADFYPSNCTSVVQPLDLGVIKCFKQVYRKQLVQGAVCLMDTGKGVQLKIDTLCTIHYIVSAWQQVTQSTIQNCYLSCGHVKKNQEGSDVMEVSGSGEDDITQDEDWVRLGASTAGVEFDAYMSVDQELAMCGVVGWGVELAWRRGQVMVVMMTMKLFFTETLCVRVNESVHVCS
jgi:hypothetical protein